MARFLARKGFAHGPTILGWLEFKRPDHESITLANLREFLPEAQDAWVYLVETATRYFERVRSIAHNCEVDPNTGGPLFEMIKKDFPENIVRIVGTPLELARLLGQRTAEMHLLLGSEPENKEFAPEPFTPFYQRSLFQSIRNNIVGGIRLLNRNFKTVPEKLRSLASKVVSTEQHAVAATRSVHEVMIDAKRIRCHENYHLGQLLYTGKDFIVIDFEGDPAKPFGERRIKHSPLYDVASMLRSLDQVSTAALLQQVATGAMGEPEIMMMTPWAAFWSRWVGAAFLKSYFAKMGKSDLLPNAPHQSAVLLHANLLGRCFQELGSAVLNHPESIGVPMQAAIQLVQAETTGTPPWFAPKEH
jgi:maltose alpha-D-glucosyltransferase/alpha-amylase